ncbi:MAG: 16S rRNA (guanine(527)-N(7))-methyltransferase RsmG [Bifidobacteriaceae bacterium]|jgi:16S rRNA (guanine527-N7)-methyltransferase|nr:16S rRNA (guanine(527)-N(7))-methyltransferase RsmG [Bifidobacteriaceae bacterium]
MLELFGPALPQVERLAGLLEANADRRGLMGPREVGRLWQRHLANSALLAPLLPAAGLVIDVGSGPGLPGLVLAAMRPDLRFELVDSMRRRTDWLTLAADQLGLGNVAVTWARAESLEGRQAAAAVSRAVARLDKLAAWTAGLLAPGGLFLAMKGASAEAELAACRPALERHRLRGAEVLELSPPPAAAPPGLEATFVVRARKHS